MTIAPILILAVFAAVWAFSVKIMRSTLSTLSDPREVIHTRLHVPSEPDLRQPLRTVDLWARDNGFADDIMFDFRMLGPDHALFCQTWKHALRRTYLIFYFGLGRHYVELVTIYDDKTGVTTTNAPEAHTLPAAPGAFIQCFPERTLDDLLERHQDGCATLERRTGLTPQNRPEETTELVIMALQRQARYVQSIPGWQWKGLWWMTVRKKRMIGRDVGWQLDQFGVYEPAAPAPDTLQ